MLTVGIGNSMFHTMCVIIATLFSNCTLRKYCTFLFIIILVPVRYVFIKKRLLYLVCEMVHCPPHRPELQGNPPSLLFKKHLTPRRPMGSQAERFEVVYLSSRKTSKSLQLPALLLQLILEDVGVVSCACVGRQVVGLGFPLCQPSTRSLLLQRGSEAGCGSTHLPS